MNSTAIECKLIREGGTRADIGGTEYHFAPYTDGAHVCEVANEEHADRFLSITDGYRLYRGEGKPVDGKAAAPAQADAPADDGTDPVYAGSDVRPALVEQYTALYGRKPHYTMTVEKLQAAIDAKQ